MVDLDSLLRDFARDESFWPGLTARAEELDLTRPLYYALRYAVRLLATPVPAGVLRAAEIGLPPSLLRGLVDAVFLRTLQAERAEAAEGLASLAPGSLYVRAHRVRMPPLLLTYHLLIKAFRREQ